MHGASAREAGIPFYVVEQATHALNPATSSFGNRLFRLGNPKSWSLSSSGAVRAVARGMTVRGADALPANLATSQDGGIRVIDPRVCEACQGSRSLSLALKKGHVVRIAGPARAAPLCSSLS